MRRHKHCRVSTLSSISAIFNQLPCLGVYTISKRERKLRASAAGKALYKDETLCVFRLSQTKLLVLLLDTPHLITSSPLTPNLQRFDAHAQDTRRHPESASVKRKSDAVPLRLYS